MTEIDLVKFYKNQKLPGYDKIYSEVLEGVMSNPTFLGLIRTDPLFFAVAFPTIDMANAGKDFSPLYTDVELTRRALTLYICILHRLGFRLYDPVSGAFDLLEDLDRFAVIRPSAIFGSKVAAQENGPILEAVLRAMPLLGFMHYTIYLNNAIHRSFLVGKYGETTGWFYTRIDNLSLDLIHLEEIRKTEAATQSTDPVPFPEWIVQWRSTEFKNTLVGKPDASKRKQLNIRHEPTNGAINTIALCDHGVYMRTAHVEGKSHKMFVCMMESQRPGSGHACPRRYPCR